MGDRKCDSSKNGMTIFPMAVRFPRKGCLMSYSFFLNVSFSDASSYTVIPIKGVGSLWAEYIFSKPSTAIGFPQSEPLLRIQTVRNSHSVAPLLVFRRSTVTSR